MNGFIVHPAKDDRGPADYIPRFGNTHLRFAEDHFDMDARLIDSHGCVSQIEARSPEDCGCFPALEILRVAASLVIAENRVRIHYR